MFRNLKIGQKLILLLFLISLIPVFAISISNYFYAKLKLEKMTKDALQAVTNSRAYHINHSIRFRQEQAKQIAGSFLLRQLSETGFNDPSIIQDIQSDIESTFYDLNAPPTSHYKYIDQRTNIAIIGVWNVHGNIIANTRKELIGRKMPLEYIRNVYEQGIYFRGFERDPLTGENLLIILEEIRNWKTNRLAGAVSLGIKGKILNDITTAREGLGKSGETYIVDKHYRMITQSRFIKDSILNVKVMTSATQACFAGKSAPTVYTNYRGVEVVGVQKYLPDEQWCLVAEIDAAEALAPVNALRNRTLIIGGLLIFVLAVLAYFASYSFIRPLLRLHDASQQVAKGNYNVSVPVESGDEIGELTKAFNEMAKSLQKFTLELEEKNKALFRSLAETTRQKKELREVNAELDSFVYTASHDLRAPLRGIASFASFLEEDYKDKLDEQGREYLEEIHKGAAKMDALIEDLLTLSRISRIKNPYEDVDMNQLIPDILDRIKFDIKQHNVEVQIQPNLPTVYCDRIKISEVFLNLINNGIKFSSKNVTERPRIEVGCVEEGEVYKFYVKDNGIGIDPRYHDQIFGIFKRLHTDKEYEGTGAGLSIVKRIVEDHGGRIWVESEVGKGACFYFTIPKDLKEKAVVQKDLDETDRRPRET